MIENKRYLSEEEMEELYPHLDKHEKEEMLNVITVFTDLFFDCIKKKIRHNELDEQK